ncbi:MAG TPA: ABC transporter ATP-binding protein, partial [Candidatus Marinimicrobia bacterium]|nr:ABC transporter ATP-binding protein [Candidatus Neomarinimicrobiota bacterium]
SYGNKLIYKDLNFSVQKGKIFGILGKNGMGKTTTINILMGFLRPTSGKCYVLGEESHNLLPQTRSRIGLLHEGHVCYEFMTVAQVEKFYSRFFPNWRKDLYYGLIDRLGVSYDHKISHMSCGQRSQVALGLIMAQDPELMILDDYSMGLDAGYRMLFIDYLIDYVRENNKTVFMTSHIIQDLEQVIDDAIIIGRQKILLQMPIREFLDSFRQYHFKVDGQLPVFEHDDVTANWENIKNSYTLYSFKTAKEVQQYLTGKGIIYTDFREISMNLEHAFIGLTGKY